MIPAAVVPVVLETFCLFYRPIGERGGGLTTLECVRAYNVRRVEISGKNRHPGNNAHNPRIPLGDVD